MKKIIALIVMVVLCLSMCACGNNRSPIVGTWHSYIMGTTFTYTFKANGEYLFLCSGAIDLESDGTYVFDEEDSTVTLMESGSTEESTNEVRIRDCCMIMDGTKYGKAYSKSESCDVLDAVLGRWVYTDDEESYLEFNKDETCSLTTNSEKETGIYIYDPLMKELEIPNADWVFVFGEDGNSIYLKDNALFSFER